MVTKIIDGISIKLNQVFGDGYEIYSEDVTQGLQEPCFFIAILNPSRLNLLGNRKLGLQPFDIHFFPSLQDDNHEIQNMASDLYEALEWITLESGDLLHGTKMNYESVDGVLHFFVNYNLTITKVVVPEETMGILTMNGNVKG